MTLESGSDVDRDQRDAIDLSRVLVLGCSCVGKTTFARRLSATLEAPRIELDSLHWGPNWTARPHEELRCEVESYASQDRWVIDGCYFALQDVLWPRATAAIWLNYSLSTVAWRAITRTFRRSILREQVYNGNRESLFRTFCTRDSFLLWVFTSYSERRRMIGEALQQPDFHQLSFREFKRPSSADQFLTDLGDTVPERSA